MSFIVKRKSDANHKAIVEELEKRGIYVVDLASSGSGICDIATWYKGQLVFVELKYGKDAKLKKTQVKFLSEYPGFCGIAIDADRACALAMMPMAYSLTLRQKDRLAAFYLKMEGKEVHLPTIVKLLES